MFPRIAGQPADYLERQLRDFKRGTRDNPMMQPIAAALTDNDIQAVARYYSEQSPPLPAARKIDPALAARGYELATRGDWPRAAPACVRCHGPNLAGIAPAFPSLRGQSEQYLAAQLDAFHDGSRSNDPLALMRRALHGLTDDDLNAVAAYVASLGDQPLPPRLRPAPANGYRHVPQSPEHFTPPPENALPAGEQGAMVWRGEQIFTDTQKYAHTYVGNTLNCVNCHLDRGRLAGSAPMWAAYVIYPKYRGKNHEVNTLAERIRGCFRYSMNGKPPAADSDAMTALVTYFYWLATGLPTGITPAGQGYPPLKPLGREPDLAHGAKLYAANCALCHGDNGEGREARGAQVFPPLWGKESFNWGAGMERISTAAAFIRANMPYGAGNTLSEADAWDVAAFVVSHPRPQDPRFTGSVETTRARFHAEDSYYGRTVDGHVLGAPPR